MKQTMVRKAMQDSVYQSYLVTNLRQLSNHPWLRSTFQRNLLVSCTCG
jgi:hypothetical protein